MFLLSENLINKKRIESFLGFYAKGDNWHKIDPSSGNLGYGWIHYALIRILRPKRVLCIGSRWGLIPAICALACKDNGVGVVDFVDAGFDMGDYEGSGEHWGGVGWWKKCDPKKYFGKFGLEKQIKLHVMTSEEFFKKHKNQKFGYAHIDGDHSYEGVYFDYKTFWPSIEKGGYMAFHDIGSPDKDGNVYGTRKFWCELKEKTKGNYIEFNEDPGIGIIQKA